MPKHKRFVLLQDKATVSNGRLLRRLHSAGRVGYVAIVDETTTHELGMFWDTVSALAATRVNQLVDDVPFQMSITPGQALNLLAHYKMLTWEEE